MTAVDVEVVGSGPNGLAAAVTLARAGLSVRVYERAAQFGGGARTREEIEPGFRFDTCSAVHPLAVASPFFRAFGLAERVEFVTPEISFAHPLVAGASGIAYRDLDRTVDGLGHDGAAYRRLIGPLAERAREVARVTGSPLVGLPPHPIVAARFGLRALAQGTARGGVFQGMFGDTFGGTGRMGAPFRGEAAPAMITGVAAHSIARQPSVAAAAAGLALQTHAHAAGWPIPLGGSQAIADALADDLRAHGGDIVTGREIASLGELSARAVILDVTPRALLRLAGAGGDRMPQRYRHALERFRYGSGAATVHFALSGPVPWADARIGGAGTVHLGGTRAQIAAAENAVLAGRHAASPYVIVSQPSVFDPSRAPAGAHALWTYTHVPAGSTTDQTEAITRAIEEHAPGFRDVILGSSSMTAADLEEHDPNYIGGDIGAGATTLGQLIARPVLSPDPWRTPLRGTYLCGAATTPGPGVHGQSGWFAARSALRHEFGLRRMPSLAP